MKQNIRNRLAKTNGNRTIGDKAYVIQYIADAPNYSDHLPTVQNMINSLVIKNTMSDHAKKKPQEIRIPNGGVGRKSSVIE